MPIDQIGTAGIANGAVIPADLSTGSPTWDTSGNTTFTGQLRSNAASTPPTFADSAGTQIGTLCRAWVQCNSTGTIAASFNVSSVTYSATGLYTINFANAMPDANYSYVAWSSSGGAACLIQQGSQSTTQLGVQGFTSTNGTNLQVSKVCVAVFR